MENCEGWEAVRTVLRRRVGEAAFEAWFRALDGRLEGETLVLRCPDRFSRDWLRARYGKLIEECAAGARTVDYRVDPVADSAARGSPGRKGMRCSATQIGPIPGPPPPCGMQNVLCRFK